MKTLKDVPQATLAEFKLLIAQSIATTSAQVQADIDAGKHLTDNPVAVMNTRPTPCSGATPPHDDEEDIWIYRSDRRIQRHRFSIGQNGYISARNAWAAYAPIQKALEELSWNEEDIFNVITDIFPPGHHVYGALTLLFHQKNEESDTLVLMGIRGNKLAGMNVGYASFPGGLVKPGENLPNACIRELKEEGARGNIEIFPGFSMGPHNAAPSVTFMRAGRTTSTDVADSYEWEGKTMIWVPKQAVTNLLFNGENTALVEAFRAQGLNPKDDLAIAPDAVLPAQILLEQFVI